MHHMFADFTMHYSFVVTNASLVIIMNIADLAGESAKFINTIMPIDRNK